MVRREYRRVQRVDGVGGRRWGAPSTNAVLAAVEYDAADVGDLRERRGAQVVGVDLAVYAQRADLARELRVLFAAQIDDEYDVLLHVHSSCFY